MIMKIKNFFDERFDNDKFFLVFRFIIIIFLIVLCLNFFTLTLSKYATETKVNIAPTLAFFITDVGSYEDKIELDSILPSATPYYYSFTVSNFKDEEKANVNIEYDIEFVTTTNLPLNFKIYKDSADFSGNGIITGDRIITNDEGMHFRQLETNLAGSFSYQQKETNTYILWVEFPEVYKNSPETYEGIIDLIEIKVKARQVI